MIHAEMFGGEQGERSSWIERVTPAARRPPARSGSGSLEGKGFGGWRVGDPVIATDSGRQYEMAAFSRSDDGAMSVGLFELERPARYARAGTHTIRLFDRMETLGVEGAWPPTLSPQPRRGGQPFATMSLSSPALPRALQHRESRFSYRDERWALEARWDPIACEFVFEGYERVDCGLRYYSARRIDGAVDRFLAQLALRGVYWERPYILGDRQSHGRGPCELALLQHFCARYGLDADAVHAWAYPGAPRPDWDDISLLAEWQGVVYPERWDHWALRQLFSALAPTAPVLDRILSAIAIQREERQGAA